MPFLTFPLALLALATVPALTAIYILRNRFRRRQVSSLMLWQFRVQSKEGGVKLHRLQLPLLFFLELLALLMLVTAAAGPHWNLPQSARPLIVVLDDSFSMRAVRNDRPARTRAREFLERLFQRQPPPSTRFVLAGTEPRLLGSPIRKWSEAEDLLQQWQCWSASESIESALTLAAELGGHQANILILTDHKPMEEKVANDRIEWHAFGAPLENLAIVTASRTMFGEQDRCLLEIANLADTARQTKLLVQTGTDLSQASLVSLAPRERKRFVFNIASATPELRAVLDPDALAEDNEVRLLPPLRKKVRVRVALTDSNLNELATRALESTGLRATLTENPELVIHQVETSVLSSNAWSLRWNSPADSTAFTGPFLVDGSHPLAQGVALPGVVWSGASATNPPGEVPVILAGNTPLLSVREDAVGRRHIALNLNPQLSTLPSTPDWPVLFWNLLQWRAAEKPGLHESNARLGSEVLLKTTGEPVTVTWPDGSRHVFPKPVGALALETPWPGIYHVAMGEVTNRFAVNPLAPGESDLQSCATGHWGNWGAGTEGRTEQTSTGWAFGLLALALLSAHLYLVATGRGGR